MSVENLEKPAGILQLVFRTKNQLRNVFLEIELHGSKEDSFSLNKKWIQRVPIEVKSETCEHKSSLSISNSHMLVSKFPTEISNRDFRPYRIQPKKS